MKLLLEHGAKLNERGESGWESPLLEAISLGDRDIAALLLDHGANIEFRMTPEGCTPLIVACRKGVFSTVKLLLDRGANLNARYVFKSGDYTITDDTPITAVIKSGNSDM